MPIETLDDWNAILGQCCCEMPECPVPTRECQSDIAGYYANSLDFFDGQYYLTITQLYSYFPAGGGPLVIDELITTTIRSWGLAAGPCGETNPPPDPFIGTPLEGNLGITSNDFVSRADPFSLTDFKTTILADYAGYAFDEGCAAGSSCVSSVGNGINAPHSSNAIFTRSRFRWVIPDTWTGSYFKITWDVATYPTDPLAEISYIQDLTWEWTGPGDPMDPDSWKSGWYLIDPPGEPGERKVVNIRFECYRSPQFGNKPQITGDAEDITDDVPLQYRFTSDNHSINLLHL